MAPLRCAAKFDPFLSLDCARVEGVGHLATLQSVGFLSDIPHFREIFLAAFFSCAEESYGRREGGNLETYVGSFSIPGGQRYVVPDPNI